MITKDFVKDIELYICEKFGYRNSVYVNPTCNGWRGTIRRIYWTW